MVGEKLEEIMVEKGLPVETVNRINPEKYSSLMKKRSFSTDYNPDKVLNEQCLNIRDTDLKYLGLDLDENIAFYHDNHNLSKVGYSGDGFKTSLVFDERYTPWIVDTVDETNCFYFNTHDNQFYPNYNPEIVDPMSMISKIWRETKSEMVENE